MAVILIVAVTVPSPPIVQLSPVANSTPSRPPPCSHRTTDEIMMEEAVIFLAR